MRGLQQLGREKRVPLYCTVQYSTGTHVIHRPTESVRLRRPRAAVGGTRMPRRTTGDACSYSPYHEGMRACVRTGVLVSTRDGLTSPRGYDQNACYRLCLLLNMSVAAAAHVVLICFSGDDGKLNGPGSPRRVWGRRERGAVSMGAKCSVGIALRR